MKLSKSSTKIFLISLIVTGLISFLTIKQPKMNMFSYVSNNFTRVVCDSNEANCGTDSLVYMLDGDVVESSLGDDSKTVVSKGEDFNSDGPAVTKFSIYQDVKINDRYAISFSISYMESVSLIDIFNDLTLNLDYVNKDVNYSYIQTYISKYELNSEGVRFGKSVELTKEDNVYVKEAYNRMKKNVLDKIVANTPYTYDYMGIIGFNYSTYEKPNDYKIINNKVFEEICEEVS